MNITITVTEQEMSMLFQALGELPLKISGPLFSKLQQQAMQAQASTQQAMQAQASTQQAMQAQASTQQTAPEDHSAREF